MHWFDDLRISRKLILGSGVVVLLNAVVGVFALTQLERVNRTSGEIAETWLPAVKLDEKMGGLVLSLRVKEYRHILTSDPAEKAHVEQQIDSLAVMLRDVEAQYEPMIGSAEERGLYAEFQRLWTRYEELRRPVLATSAAGDTDGALALLVGESNTTFQRLQGKLDDLAGMNQTGARAANARAKAVYVSTRRVLLGAILLSILLGLGFAVATARRFRASLVAVGERAEQLRRACITQLGTAMQALAEGDLSVPVSPVTPLLEIEDADEIGDLARTVDGTIRQTRETVAAFEAARGALRAALAEIGTLIASAQAGELSRRGAAERFRGAYRDLIEGMNQMLDATTAPIRESSAVIARLAEGDFATRVEGNYAGDHAVLKENLNRTIATPAPHPLPDP